MSTRRGTDLPLKLEDEEIEELLSWIDSIPLSRPKRNIARDFSDGVLAAEVVSHKLPRLVDLNNYSQQNSTAKKMDNWELLNRKVFNKLRLHLAEDVIKDIAVCKAGVVERLLWVLRQRIDRAHWDAKHTPLRLTENERPEADQNSTYNPPAKNGRSAARAASPFATTLTVNRPEDMRFDRVMKNKAKAGPVLSDKDLRSVTSSTSDTSSASASAGPQSDEPVTDREAGGDDREQGKPEEEESEVISPRKAASKEKPNAGPYRGLNAPTKGATDEKVPIIILEEKEQECLAKDETIQILQAKIKRLEHLLHLKDIRIEDLQSRLESTRPTGKSWEVELPALPPVERGPPAGRVAKRGPKDTQLSRRLRGWFAS